MQTRMHIVSENDTGQRTGQGGHRSRTGALQEINDLASGTNFAYSIRHFAVTVSADFSRPPCMHMAVSSCDVNMRATAAGESLSFA
jgi:hypothetical protein